MDIPAAAGINWLKDSTPGVRIKSNQIIATPVLYVWTLGHPVSQGAGTP